MEYTVSADEIRRVKGLGFLQDKRYPDVFNARVITVNGKISAAQHRALAEAAEKFGSGELAMTVRLTIEIQGVKYENIEPLRAFLAEHGLYTGGTGKKVRPVVSCKGTTCISAFTKECGRSLCRINSRSRWAAAPTTA